MPIKVINLTDTLEYESQFDTAKGTDSATVFSLVPLPNRINAVLKDRATKFTSSAGGGMVADFRANDVALDIVRFGLKGIKRLEDAKGKPVKFHTQEYNFNGTQYPVVHDDLLDVIPLDVLRELSAQINSMSVVPEQEEKNSEG